MKMKENTTVNRLPEMASDAMMRRLPAYYRQLSELDNMGFIDLSSKDLARRMGLTDSQIRHDFNAFGGFGRRGRGYTVALLRRAIGDILDINQPHNLIILGAGNIGRALAQYGGFSTSNFKVVGLFDANEDLVGKKFGGIRVYSLSSLQNFVKKNDVSIAIIATPGDRAQSLVEPLAQAGVKGIWNFAPVEIVAPEGMVVTNIHLTDSLMMLTFRMHEQDVLSSKTSWVKE